MLTAYLDQNKWVDLARAETGHPQGEVFVEVLLAVKQAVADGLVRFPLSSAHYFETGKAGDPQRRMDLARTMYEVSGGAAIAPPHAIVPWEIETALVDVFGIDTFVPPLEIFGQGVAHAFASETLAYRAPESWNGVALPPLFRAQLEEMARPDFEVAVLADVMPAGVPSPARLALHQHKRLTDGKFVEGQQEVRDRLDQIGRHRLRDMMLATAVQDIKEPLALCAYKLGIAPERLFADIDQVRELVEKIPSRWVEMELRRVRQSNPQKKWEDNDLNDVTALAIAVPYCDLVVTERHWTGVITSAKIDQRFGTQVIRDLRQLPSFFTATGPT